jgi:hypothetical protein
MADNFRRVARGLRSKRLPPVCTFALPRQYSPGCFPLRKTRRVATADKAAIRG